MRLRAIVIIGIGSIAPMQIWADSVSSRATVPDTISNGSVEGQPHTDRDEKRTVTVIAHGLGGTIESAAQDAAQNALTEVVGSFIDSDKLVEKHAQISDGIRSETKNISSNIREYSQGTIQQFDVVGTTQEGPIIKVEAKITVRIDDFKAYIRKVAVADVAINSGLFAQMATAQKQAVDKQSIVTKMIQSVLRGEVIRFMLDKPQSLSTSHFMKDHVKEDCCNIDSLQWTHEIAPLENTCHCFVVFHVHGLIDSGFYNNTRKALLDVADDKIGVEAVSPKQFQISEAAGPKRLAAFDSGSVVIGLQSGGNVTEGFLLKGVNAQFKARSALILRILDKEGNAIFEVNEHKSGFNPSVSTTAMTLVNYPSFIQGGMGRGYLAYFPRSWDFDIIVPIPNNVLAAADRAVVEIAQ
jgi:hypothetical protein